MSKSENILKLVMVGDHAVGKTSFLLRFSDRIFYQSNPPTITQDYKSRSMTVKGQTIKIQLWVRKDRDCIGDAMTFGWLGSDREIGVEIVAICDREIVLEIVTKTLSKCFPTGRLYWRFNDHSILPLANGRMEWPLNLQYNLPVGIYYKQRIVFNDTAGSDRFRSVTSSYYRGAQGVLLMFDVTNRGSFDSLKLWQDELQRYAMDGTTVVLIGTKADLPENRAVKATEAELLAEACGYKYFETSAKIGLNVEESVTELVTQIYTRLVRTGRLERSESVALDSDKKHENCSC